MGLDAGIFNLIGKGVRSVNDYDTDAQNLIGLRQKNSMGALALEDAQQGQADDRSFRSAAAGFGDDTMANYRAALKISPKLASGYLKSALDNQKTQVDITKGGAETGLALAKTGASKLDQKVKALEFHVQQVGTLTDPSQVADWYRQGVESGSMTADEAQQSFARSQSMLQQPGGFKAWQQAAMKGGMSATEQMKAQAEAEKQAQVARNDYILPDGSVNTALVGAKAHVAKSGASSVNVKVDNALGEGVAKQVGPMVETSYNAANAAQQTIATSDALIKAVDSGKVFTGPGASMRMGIAQLAETMGIGGKDTAEKIANTRATVQGLAQSTLSQRGALKGQGQVSDFEGKLIERAASGDIDGMTGPEIKQIAQVNKRMGKQLIAQHTQLTARLRQHSPTAPVADLFDLNPGTNGPSGGIVDYGSLK